MSAKVPIDLMLDQAAMVCHQAACLVEESLPEWVGSSEAQNEAMRVLRLYQAGQVPQSDFYSPTALRAFAKMLSFVKKEKPPVQVASPRGFSDTKLMGQQ